MVRAGRIFLHFMGKVKKSAEVALEARLNSSYHEVIVQILCHLCGG